MLALALIPVLGVDVLLEARSRAALEKLARAAAPFADVVRDRHVVSVEARWVLVRDYDFDAVGKHMSHVWHALDADETYVVAAKGAVEGILAHSRCDESARRAVLAANGQMAAKGLRVLALAGRRMNQLGAGRDEDERDQTVYGLLGFQDPLRPEVPAAVAECQHAGIRIR